MYHLRHIGPDSESARLMCLTKAVSLVGRNVSQVDYVLCSRNSIMNSIVSRRHCRLKAINGVVEIIDDSRNGVFINDIKIDGKAVLAEGDVVTMGHPSGEKISPGSRVRQPSSEYQYILEKCFCRQKAPAEMDAQQKKSWPTIDDKSDLACTKSPLKTSVSSTSSSCKNMQETSTEAPTLSKKEMVSGQNFSSFVSMSVSRFAKEPSGAHSSRVQREHPAVTCHSKLGTSEKEQSQQSGHHHDPVDDISVTQTPSECFHDKGNQSASNPEICSTKGSVSLPYLSSPSLKGCLTSPLPCEFSKESAPPEIRVSPKKFPISPPGVNVFETKEKSPGLSSEAQSLSLDPQLNTDVLLDKAPVSPSKADVVLENATNSPLERDVLSKSPISSLNKPVSLCTKDGLLESAQISPDVKDLLQKSSVSSSEMHDVPLLNSIHDASSELNVTEKPLPQHDPGQQSQTESKADLSLSEDCISPAASDVELKDPFSPSCHENHLENDGSESSINDLVLPPHSITTSDGHSTSSQQEHSIAVDDVLLKPDDVLPERCVDSVFRIDVSPDRDHASTKQQSTVLGNSTTSPPLEVNNYDQQSQSNTSLLQGENVQLSSEKILLSQEEECSSDYLSTSDKDGTSLSASPVSAQNSDACADKELVAQISSELYLKGDPVSTKYVNQIKRSVTSSLLQSGSSHVMSPEMNSCLSKELNCNDETSKLPSDASILASLDVKEERTNRHDDEGVCLEGSALQGDICLMNVQKSDSHSTGEEQPSAKCDDDNKHSVVIHEDSKEMCEAGTCTSGNWKTSLESPAIRSAPCDRNPFSPSCHENHIKKDSSESFINDLVMPHHSITMTDDHSTSSQQEHSIAVGDVLLKPDDVLPEQCVDSVFQMVVSPDRDHASTEKQDIVLAGKDCCEEHQDDQQESCEHASQQSKCHSSSTESGDILENNPILKDPVLQPELSREKNFISTEEECASYYLSTSNRDGTSVSASTVSVQNSDPCADKEIVAQIHSELYSKGDPVSIKHIKEMVMDGYSLCGVTVIGENHIASQSENHSVSPLDALVEQDQGKNSIKSCITSSQLQSRGNQIMCPDRNLCLLKELNGSDEASKLPSDASVLASLDVQEERTIHDDDEGVCLESSQSQGDVCFMNVQKSDCHSTGEEQPSAKCDDDNKHSVVIHEDSKMCGAGTHTSGNLKTSLESPAIRSASCEREEDPVRKLSSFLPSPWLITPQQQKRPLRRPHSCGPRPKRLRQELSSSLSSLCLSPGMYSNYPVNPDPQINFVESLLAGTLKGCDNSLVEDHQFSDAESTDGSYCTSDRDHLQYETNGNPKAVGTSLESNGQDSVDTRDKFDGKQSYATGTSVDDEDENPKLGEEPEEVMTSVGSPASSVLSTKYLCTQCGMVLSMEDKENHWHDTADDGNNSDNDDDYFIIEEEEEDRLDTPESVKSDLPYMPCTKKRKITFDEDVCKLSNVGIHQYEHPFDPVHNQQASEMMTIQKTDHSENDINALTDIKKKAHLMKCRSVALCSVKNNFVSSVANTSASSLSKLDHTCSIVSSQSNKADIFQSSDNPHADIQAVVSEEQGSQPKTQTGVKEEQIDPIAQVGVGEEQRSHLDAHITVTEEQRSRSDTQTGISEKQGSPLGASAVVTEEQRNRHDTSISVSENQRTCDNRKISVTEKQMSQPSTQTGVSEQQRSHPDTQPDVGEEQRSQLNAHDNVVEDHSESITQTDVGEKQRSDPIAHITITEEPRSQSDTQTGVTEEQGSQLNAHDNVVEDQSESNTQTDVGEEQKSQPNMQTGVSQEQKSYPVSLTDEDTNICLRQSQNIVSDKPPAKNKLCSMSDTSLLITRFSDGAETDDKYISMGIENKRAGCEHSPCVTVKSAQEQNIVSSRMKITVSDCNVVNDDTDVKCSDDNLSLSISEVREHEPGERNFVETQTQGGEDPSEDEISLYLEPTQSSNGLVDESEQCQATQSLPLSDDEVPSARSSEDDFSLYVDPTQVEKNASPVDEDSKVVFSQMSQFSSELQPKILNIIESLESKRGDHDQDSGGGLETSVDLDEDRGELSVILEEDENVVPAEEVSTGNNSDEHVPNSTSFDSDIMAGYNSHVVLSELEELQSASSVECDSDTDSEVFSPLCVNYTVKQPKKTSSTGVCANTTTLDAQSETKENIDCVEQ